MEQLVCVTGASGYIASWLVKLLLSRGYTVNATVRNLSDPARVEHLKALQGAGERLHLYEADLLHDGSFDDAIHGCRAVFHTASPVILEFHHLDNPQAEVIEPAVKGTLNVLKSCAKTTSVKRVVLTSSMASVMFRRSPTDVQYVVDETWYSDPIFAKEVKHWYVLSKTLAEEAAIKFAQQNGVDLVVINPGLVIGPLLQPSINETTGCFISLITQGKSDSGMPGGVFTYVDVRDVAHAHVSAIEDPSAHGRYCVVAQILWCSHALAILRPLYPNLTLPNSPEDNYESARAVPFLVSNDKAKKLGVKFISVGQSMKDTIQSLEDKNLFTFTP